MIKDNEFSANLSSKDNDEISDCDDLDTGDHFEPIALNRLKLRTSVNSFRPFTMPST